MELKNTHELVGQAGFIPKTIKDTEYIELNYYIDKSKWGKGFAKEIAKALIEYGFKVKKLDKIIAIIDLENEASKAVAKALGMKYWINETRSGKTKSVYSIKNESK